MSQEVYEPLSPAVEKTVIRLAWHLQAVLPPEGEERTGCGTMHQPQRLELRQRRHSSQPQRQKLCPQMRMRACVWQLQRLRLQRLRCMFLRKAWEES